MGDRKVLFRSGPRVDELSPSEDRARIAGIVSAAALDLAAATGNPVQITIGDTAKVTITPEGRLDTTAESTAALRVGSRTGDPPTLGNGDLWYDSSTGKFRARQNGVSVDVIGNAAGGAIFNDESFIPSNDQTLFTLSQPCIPNGLTVLDVNGIIYTEGVNYTVSGSVLTWLNVDFNLKSSDVLTIRYQTA